MKKILIAYYSHSGNTRTLAELISQQTGGDLFELQPESPYPNDYDTVVRQAKRELSAGYMPPLKTQSLDPSEYDLILIGSPNWWNTVAPPVMTFLSSCELSGKSIAPFITHEGSGLGRNTVDIAKLVPRATVLNGLAVRGGKVQADKHHVSEWLQKFPLAA